MISAHRDTAIAGPLLPPVVGLSCCSECLWTLNKNLISLRGSVKAFLILKQWSHKATHFNVVLRFKKNSLNCGRGRHGNRNRKKPYLICWWERSYDIWWPDLSPLQHWPPAGHTVSQISHATSHSPTPDVMKCQLSINTCCPDECSEGEK